MQQRFKTLDAWLDWQQSLHFADIDMGLERMHQMVLKLHLQVPSFSIITVAGTNGKGSSVAMLDAIYQEAGYKTGAYTSPYLYQYNERMTLSGQMVSDAEIMAVFEQIEQKRADTPLTYFEFSTLAAILLFEQHQVDVAILEVGMGGRLDAVNAWDCDVALISSIGIDHVKWLGDTREKIAFEKSGVIREGKVVVSGDPNPPKVISQQAQEKKAILRQVGVHFYIDEADQSWTWSDGTKILADLPKPNLQGDYQIMNAANTLTVIDSMQPLLPVSEQAIRLGLENIKLKGRLQIIQQSPLIVLDVAHNAHAARMLKKWLETSPCEGKTLALFSMLSDKDIDEVIQVLDPVISHWHVFTLEDPRGFTFDELNETFKAGKVQLQQFSLYQSIGSAINESEAQLEKNDRLIVFGSFSVLAEYQQAIKGSSIEC